MLNLNLRQKILLSLLKACNKRSMSPIQIMKALFLYSQQAHPAEFYKFEPYLYGPCSFEVYHDLRILLNEGLISSTPSLYSWDFYSITSQGEEMIKEVDKQIEEIKKFVVSKPFIELLKEIYSKYPEFAKNSIINTEILKKL